MVAAILGDLRADALRAAEAATDPRDRARLLRLAADVSIGAASMLSTIRCLEYRINLP